MNSKQVYYAKNINDLLFQLNSSIDLQVVGGCTQVENIPQKFISTRQIPDLCKIERHERFIDVGPGVTLSQLLALGPNHLPQVLYKALLSVGNPFIRNLATIGGNILEKNQKLTLYAPLLALDATLDLVSKTEKESVKIRDFKNLEDGFILTNIRIPFNDGDISIFKRIGPENSINETSASFAFIAETERNAISNISLAFAGPFAFRNKTFESMLIGYRLPLSKSNLNEIQEMAEELFNKASTDIMISEVMRQQFFNLVRYAFEQLM